MISMIWPVALVVLCNTAYQICAKFVPKDIDTFASLTITYLIGAAASGIMYFVMNRDGNLLREYSHLNWASFVLGLVVVGLEVGCIFAYKNGWQVNSMQIVQSAFLAICLIIVGYILFREAITTNKVVGILICLIGLYFINK